MGCIGLHRVTLVLYCRAKQEPTQERQGSYEILFKALTLQLQEFLAVDRMSALGVLNACVEALKCGAALRQFDTDKLARTNFVIAKGIVGWKHMGLPKIRVFLGVL